MENGLGKAFPVLLLASWIISLAAFLMSGDIHPEGSAFDTMVELGHLSPLVFAFLTAWTILPIRSLIRGAKFALAALLVPVSLVSSCSMRESLSDRAWLLSYANDVARYCPGKAGACSAHVSDLQRSVSFESCKRRDGSHFCEYGSRPQSPCVADVLYMPNKENVPQEVIAANHDRLVRSLNELIEDGTLDHVCLKQDTVCFYRICHNWS